MREFQSCRGMMFSNGNRNRLVKVLREYCAIMCTHRLLFNTDTICPILVKNKCSNMSSVLFIEQREKIAAALFITLLARKNKSSEITTYFKSHKQPLCTFSPETHRNCT